MIGSSAWTYLNQLEREEAFDNFTNKPIPEADIRAAIEAAVLAPNSSNTQTWDFFWVRTTDKRKRLVEACLSQSAARTAAELIVVSANPKNWQRSRPLLIEWVKRVGAPKPVIQYYEKLIPVMYRWGLFNLFGISKMLAMSLVGFFRPVPRGPNTKRDMQEVAIKSAALAAQNLVLALTAQGHQTCMMEGFDEVRVRRVLNVSRQNRIVMVIAIGEPQENGTWGSQYRIPTESVFHVL